MLGLFILSFSYQVYQAFYAENEAMDLNTVRNEEHDVVYFEEALLKYTEQHRLTMEIRETRNIGKKFS